MKKTISRLHYITQDTVTKSHWQLAEEACHAGITWVQLRLKNKSAEEIKSITLKTLDVCRHFNCTLILNDYVSIAVECQVDGIHLGKTDIDVKDARALVGDQMIIGGTANTFEDVKALSAKGADYIGLGPFRFTTTKEKLSPVLGLKGYQEIMNQCASTNIRIPVVAIGGIEVADVADIITTGVHGIAIASAIGLAADKNIAVAEFNKTLKINDHEFTTR